jgi:hypothetical protein
VEESAPVDSSVLSALKFDPAYMLATTHAITVAARGAEWQSLGQWMIYMSVISWTTALAALRRSGHTFGGGGPGSPGGGGRTRDGPTLRWRAGMRGDSTALAVASGARRRC